MKIKISGNAFVITSDLSVEDILFVAKNAPDKLKVREKVSKDSDEVGNELFAISYNEAHASITGFGIAFNGKTRDEKGLATFTGTIPAGVANAKEFVADKISAVAAYLPELEKSVPKAVKEQKEAREKLLESITEE